MSYKSTLPSEIASWDTLASCVPAKNVTISIVICTRDRPRSLEACLRSVVRQEITPCEIIVVDDGNLGESDRTMLAYICEKQGIPFVYLRKEPAHRTPCLPASRHLGVQHARGHIVQFLDDDVTLEPDFLREIRQLYADDGEGRLIGTDGTLYEPQQGRLGARAFDWLFFFAGWWALRPRYAGRVPLPACLRDRSRAIPTLKIIGATMAFRREVLQQRPFDETLGGYALGEDRDAAYRLSRYGWIARCRRAHATHHHDSSQRPSPYTFGRMTVLNYGRIMANNGLNRSGDWLVHIHSFLVITLGVLCFSAFHPREYLPRVGGMIVGGVALAREMIVNRASPRERPV